MGLMHGVSVRPVSKVWLDGKLVDWEKAQEGEIKPERVRMVTADAMVDTGAVRCTLPPHVARRLGLKARRTQVVEYADGRRCTIAIDVPEKDAAITDLGTLRCSEVSPPGQP